MALRTSRTLTSRGRPPRLAGGIMGESIAHSASVLWQRLPLAAGREHIEDGVENLTDIDVTRSTAALGRWDHGRKHRPLRVSPLAAPSTGSRSRAHRRWR